MKLGDVGGDFVSDEAPELVRLGEVARQLKGERMAVVRRSNNAGRRRWRP